MATPHAILEELLRLRQAPAPETAKFERIAHDSLCSLIQDHLHTLLDSFEKYRHISYLVQGPRDQGVDVLLKLSSDTEAEEYFAIQVKSYKEIDNKESDLSKQLKAGLVDAHDRYGDGLKRYYILLFGHAQQHFKRITALTNEFAKNALVRVIGPRDLLTFIELPHTAISAVVDRYVSGEDYVRAEARNEMAGCTESEMYFLLACLCRAFENASAQLPDDFFLHSGRMIEVTERYGGTALADAIGRFEDSALETYATPSSVRVRVELYRAVRALYFDIQVRYGEDAGELFNHLFEFFRTEAISP